LRQICGGIIVGRHGVNVFLDTDACLGAVMCATNPLLIQCLTECTVGNAQRDVVIARRPRTSSRRNRDGAAGNTDVASSRSGSRVRAATWALHMALPLLALWLLLAQPMLDLAWDNRWAHLILVLTAALISLALAVLIGRTAGGREDARLWCVSLVFVITAGFFALHALATPGTLLNTTQAEFMLPSRIGLVLAGAVALCSAVEFTPERIELVRRLRRPLTTLVYVLMAACAFTVWLRVLQRVGDPQIVDQIAKTAAVTGGVLFAMAAVAHLPIYRRRRAVVVMSVLTAYALLAEASLAMAFGMSWHASWWLWHVLMTMAFCFIAYSAHVQFHRQGSARGLFDALATQQTVADLRHDYASALEEMVDVLDRRERGENVPPGAAAATVAERFELSEQQVAVLNRGAEALGAERDQVRKLEGLVAVGQEATIIQDEDTLMAQVMQIIRDTFPQNAFRLGIVNSGNLDFADGPTSPLAERAKTTGTMKRESGALALPLLVKGRVAGVLDARSGRGHFAYTDVALLRTFAIQASIALENVRLYRNLDGLFRSYMSPAVATALLADPAQAGLGGAIHEVSVLMADLQGFTPFAEVTPPADVVAMLNTYYGAVVPVILDEGGTVVQFIGDAVMAMWGAPARQPDHALRAARAGLALHAVIDEVAGLGDWPRFRVGINSGPALVGNIGADEFRNFTAIGDTTNLAARLEALAEPGQVMLGPNTFAALGSAAQVSSHGTVLVKGRREPVPVRVLHGLENGKP
jgi:class 3 adenylate cyclase